MKVDNAIIMAAGASSRFAPLSYETHKALIDVKGEVLIERQIKQLKSAKITDIYVVTGYMANKFEYLKDMYGVKLISNVEYNYRNNNSSIWAARHVINNSFICSSDNYFNINPFEDEVDFSYYAALYADGRTNEWCMHENSEGYIDSVTIGGENSWYMLGHTFWDSEFSKVFLDILAKEYNIKSTADKLWEKIYINHLDILKMKIRKYNKTDIYEFDTIDELRHFDDSYVENTRSKIIKDISNMLELNEGDIKDILPLKMDGSATAQGFSFNSPNGKYEYYYSDSNLKKIV